MLARRSAQDLLDYATGTGRAPPKCPAHADGECHNALPMKLSPDQVESFETHGYVGPFPLLDEAAACAVSDIIDGKTRRHPELAFPFRRRLTYRDRAYIAIQKLIARASRKVCAWGRPCDWYKSAHILVPEVARVGKAGEILEKIKSLLGLDLLLWGAQLIVKKKGESHSWHEDIEHNAWEGVTVWLGLKGVGPENTLRLIPGSHHFGVRPNEIAKLTKMDLSSDPAVLEAARKYKPDASILELKMRPGEYVAFAGRMWHGTKDKGHEFRTALILQYCRPDSRIRIPESFEETSKWYPVQPRVLGVSGDLNSNMNHLFLPDERWGNSSDLKGRVAVVTGGSQGIGLAFAARLASHGASVALAARTEARLQAACAAISFLYRSPVAGVVLDITQENSVEKGFRAVQETFGPIDILINNAGNFRALGPSWQVDISQWLADVKTNLVGPEYCSRAVLPGMLKRKRGALINIIGGGASQGISFGSAYSASKAALARLTECLALECAGNGISVFGLDPGFVRTSMTLANAQSDAGARWRPQIKQWLDEGSDVSPEFAAERLVELLVSPQPLPSGLVYGIAKHKKGNVLRYRSDIVSQLSLIEFLRAKLPSLRHRIIIGVRNCLQSARGRIRDILERQQ